MTNEDPPTMADVMATMRRGDLGRATRKIQQMLGLNSPPGRKAPPPAPNAGAGETAHAGRIIDLVAEPVGITPRSIQPASPDFSLHHFAGPEGQLAYRLHRPHTLPDGAPLIVMLHGCTQDSADFARGTAMNALAEAAGFAVLWPEQSPSANPRRCWRWFDAAHQGATSGEPAAILALCAAIAQDHRLNAGQFHIAGLSAGGAMAAILADSGDRRIAAIAVHSGLAAGTASTMAGGLGAMRRPRAPRAGTNPLVPTLILHGSADQTVVPANADRIFEQARLQAQEPLTITTIPTNHGTRTIGRTAAGRRMIERYMMDGVGHAWAGGDPSGTHTTRLGPDASRLILDFFTEQAQQRAQPRQTASRPS